MPDFPIGTIVDNKTLYQSFLCKNVGGMRRAHRTNTLVLIIDHTKPLYKDRWEEGCFYYTGMGRKGNQSLLFDQNRTLNESKENGVELHLFEVHKHNRYYYHGRVELCKDPFIETQKDCEENARNVWIFPLRFKNKT